MICGHCLVDEFLINDYCCLSTEKQLERHYLLSGDADGVILLWELSLADKKVVVGGFLLADVLIE